MKPPRLLAVALALLSAFATRSFAGPPPVHYGVNLTATVSTGISTGATTAVLKKYSVSNGTVLNAVLATGSFPGLKTSEMDIVTTNSSAGTLLVLDKSNHTIIYPLTSGSSTTTQGAVVYGNSVSTVDFIEAGSGLRVMLPSYIIGNPLAGETALTNYTFHGSLSPGINGAIKSLSISFFGGTGTTVIQGTYTLSSRTYDY